MSACHTCLLYLSQILPAATEAVPFMGPCGVELGTVLLVCERRSHACRGQRLGGRTTLDAFPKHSPAEAGGRRREGDGEKNSSSPILRLKLFRAVLCRDLTTELVMLNQ